MLILGKLGALDVLVIAAYLAAFVVMGIFAGKRVKAARDFSAAGQKLSWKLVAGSSIATCMGANMVMGKYDLILESGMAGVAASWFFWLGWLLLLCMARRLRNSGAASIPAFFKSRYGARTQKIGSYCVLIAAVSSCAAQFLSIGAICEALGICGRETGVWIGAAVIVLFTVFSGLWGVAITDTVQSIVLLIAFGVAFPLAVFKVAGGWDAVIAFNSTQRLAPFQGIAPVTMIGWAVYYAFATGAEPAFAQRILAAKDTKSAILGQVAAWAITFVIVGFISAFPGLAIHKIFPDLQAGSQFTPLFIITYLPAVVRGILIAALLGLMLTTGDTYLLLLSSTVMDDVVRPNLAREADEKKMLLCSRALCLLAAVVISCMALYVNSIYQLFKTGGGAYGAGVFFPLLFGCFWKRANTKAVNIAMCTGALVSFVFDMFLKIPLHLAIDGVVLGGSLCALICVIGSLLWPEKASACGIRQV